MPATGKESDVHLALLRDSPAVVSRSELLRGVWGFDFDGEVTDLIRTLNQMLQRLRDHEERHRQFVSDASHELRTPLMVLLADAEYAAGRASSADSNAATRADRANTAAPGLGLAIVHAEVTNAGGTVTWLESPDRDLRARSDRRVSARSTNQASEGVGGRR